MRNTVALPGSQAGYRLVRWHHDKVEGLWSGRRSPHTRLGWEMPCIIKLSTEWMSRLCVYGVGLGGVGDGGNEGQKKKNHGMIEI